MHMVIVWLLSWWYGAGWKLQLSRTKERLAGSYDYFSIGLLIKTLFSPYRQISAGRINGPIGLQLRAFVDRLFSRVIGAVVRSIFLVAGVIWLTLISVLSGISLIMWATVPFLPLAGLILFVSGWVPYVWK
jgi:hypothetical protein